MNLRVILDSSIALSLYREWYDFFEQRLIRIYQQSELDRLTREFSEKIKNCFRDSLLGGMVETKVTAAALDNSLLPQHLIRFYKRCKDRINNYLKFGFAIKLAEDTKERLILSPVKTISVTLVTAVLVNLLLSLVLHHKISPWGWLLRGLFLSVASCGLFSQADWPTVKATSIFLRRLQERIRDVRD